MSPQEHYKKADEILASVAESQKAVTDKVEEGGFVNPAVVEAIYKNLTLQVALAQAHATLANTTEPSVFNFSFSEEDKQKMKDDAEAFTEKAREAFEDGVSRAKAAYEAFTAPRPVKDSPQA